MAEETANYHRLITLVIDIATKALRDVLLFRIQPDSLAAVFQRNMNTLNGLLQRRVLFQDQFNLLTRPDPDVEEFDISLLFVIFRNQICPRVVPPLNGWYIQNLSPLDNSLGAELLRLTEIRNKIAHLPATKIETQEFENTWNEMERIIIRIARHGSLDKAQYFKTKIDELKQRHLDTSRTTHIESFWIWHFQENNKNSEILNQLLTQNDRIINLGEEAKANTEELFRALLKEVLEIKHAQQVSANTDLNDVQEGQNPTDLDNNSELEDGPLCIVSRAEWKARPAKQFDHMVTPVPLVFIHHTAWQEFTIPDKCSKEMKHLQNHHMDVNGWDDIGYNFVIGGDARVYEGRGWDRVGAHTKGWNSISVSFAIMGDYHDHLPDPKVLRTVCRLMDLGVTLKKLTEDFKLYGHRDASRTLGPGEKLYNEIRKWKRYGPLPPKKETII